MIVDQVSADWLAANFEVPKKLCDRALGIWTLTHEGTIVLVFGLTKKAFIGAVWLWVILPEGFRPTPKILRAARELVREGVRRYGKLEALAAPGRDTRFAEWCGLRPVQHGDKFVRLETWQ